MSHLYGTILKPSHTNRFTDWWTSSLRDTLVSHLVLLESEQEKKTQDISGLGLQMEFDFFNQECASLKMSKDTFRWDSPQSSVIWKNWVIKVRSEYSVRVKLAQSTKGKECSSWPTANTRDWKDSVNSVPPSVGQTRGHSLGMAVAEKNWPTAATRDYKGESGSGRQERKGHPADTLPNAVAQWPTPTAGECLDQGTNWETLARLDKGGRILRRMASLEMSGPHAPVNHNTHGSRQESWATPQASDHVEGARTELTSNQKCLGRDMKQWATPKVWRTPSSSDGEGGVMEMREGCAGKYKLRDHAANGNKSAKLNQRWVETLMGLRMGWTSPSCPASVIRNWPKFVTGWLKATTAPTSYDPAEMELFQLQQSERSES